MRRSSRAQDGLTHLSVWVRSGAHSSYSCFWERTEPTPFGKRQLCVFWVCQQPLYQQQSAMKRSVINLQNLSLFNPALQVLRYEPGSLHRCSFSSKSPLIMRGITPGPGNSIPSSKTTTLSISHAGPDTKLHQLLFRDLTLRACIPFVSRDATHHGVALATCRGMLRLFQDSVHSSCPRLLFGSA